MGYCGIFRMAAKENSEDSSEENDDAVAYQVHGREIPEIKEH